MINPKLKSLIENYPIESVNDNRKILLNKLVESIVDQLLRRSHANLNFICTHNSRRSHLSQIWANLAASYYNINNISCYSGGTAVTAMYPMIREVLSEQGFDCIAVSEGANPVYAIKHGLNAPPVIAFSKVYNDSFNPQDGYIAIMTCTQADQDCPVVSGAESRIALPFLDPKAYDNTPVQAQRYMEKSIEIGTEMCYVFQQVSALVK